MWHLVHFAVVVVARARGRQAGRHAGGQAGGRAGIASQQRGALYPVARKRPRISEGNSETLKKWFITRAAVVRVGSNEKESPVVIHDDLMFFCFFSFLVIKETTPI